MPGYQTPLRIGNRDIGQGHECFILAEVAQAHDGSLGTAHAYVDAVAKTGADAVKFQTHIADAESTPGEPFRVHFSRQDATRFDYWKRMEFSAAEWRGLAGHAQDVGLVFLSTPFSFAAVDLLAELHMAAWKVGSGEVNNSPMLEKMAATGRPVLLSSGMSSWSDLDAAAATVRSVGAPLAVLQCTTAYPCPPDKIGLNVIEQLRARYGCPVGLSDHSGTIYPGLAAATLGADLLEVHVVFSRECFGPDVPASLTTVELTQLVEGVRAIETMTRSPIDKDAVAEEMTELRTMFGKSLVAARDVLAGSKLGDEDIALKKPGTGIPASRYDEIVGRRLVIDVTINTQFSEAHLEQ